MRPKDITTFTATTRDSVIGWDVQLPQSETISTSHAMNKIFDIIGIDGLESFLNDAVSQSKAVDIIIFNEDGIEHSLEYDPFTAEHDYKYDIGISLFRDMLSTCLLEFLQKVAYEEEANHA